MKNERPGNGCGFEEILAGEFTETREDALLLSAWLQEWYADCAKDDEETADADVGAAKQDNRKLAEACGGYDKEIAPGQIRILSKRFTTTPDDIPYVAVLEEWEDGVWLVAPFSKYSFPALGGEMVTGMRHAGLRVIQAWNCRTVHGRLLEKSFDFGTMPEAVREDALALFRNKMAGTALPKGFDRLCGSAILKDEDPRNGYVEIEVEKLRPLSTAVKGTELYLARQAMQERIAEMDIAALWNRMRGNDVAFAAGGRAKPATERYGMPDGGELEVSYSPQEGAVVLQFADDDGELDDSRDGWGVFTKRGFEFLGAFCDGFIRLAKEALDEGFCITDCGGVVQRMFKLQ